MPLVFFVARQWRFNCKVVLATLAWSLLILPPINRPKSPDVLTIEFADGYVSGYIQQGTTGRTTGYIRQETSNSTDISEDFDNEGTDEDASDDDTNEDTSDDKVVFHLNGSPFNNDAEGWELYNTWPSENHTEEFTSDGWTVIYLFSPGWMEKYGQSTARTCPNVGGYTETTDYDGGVTGDYQPEEPPAYNWKPLSTSERMAMEFGEQ